MAAGGKEMQLAIKIAGKIDPSYASALSKATSGLGKFTKSVSVATAAAVAAVGAMGVAAIKTGAEFEGAMSQVAATMLIDKTTAEGQKAFETLENAARECGASTAFSATEAAEALNYLALAGYDADKAATALPTVLKLAGAGAMDLAAASDMVTDSMSALGIEATEANLTQFSDQLAQTASKANTSVAQLGEAILTVGGTAKGLAGGTTELNTALGILADNGLKGAEGGTHLRNIILSLQNPTDKAADALKGLGVDVYDAQGNMRGLNDVFKDLQGAMDGMSNAQKDNVLSTLFNKTDLTAANAMLANCTDRFDELSAAVENSAGACENMYAIQLDNLNGDIDILKSGLSDLGISIYKDLNGPLREMTQLATSMVGELSEAYKSGGMEGMVGAVGGCLSEAVNEIAGYAPKMASMGIGLIGSFVQGVADNAGPLTDAAAQTMTVFTNGLFSLVPQVIFAGIDIIMRLVQSITAQLPQFMSSGAQAIVNFINGIIQRLPAIMATALTLIQVFVSGIGENVPMLVSAAIRLVAAIVDTILNTNWLEIGIHIIKSIGEGLLATGKSLLSIIKSLFTGEEIEMPDTSSQGVAVVNSYADGISNNVGTVTAAANGMAADAFSSIDTTGAMSAGEQAGAAFSASLVSSAADFDTDTFNADMTKIGNVGAEAVSSGIVENSQAAAQAAAGMGEEVNVALDGAWRRVEANAQTAMQRLETVVVNKAKSAANAIKSAFECMTITIPKPRIPVINTSYQTESYGDGGNVNIPKFSVSWNALGGIFSRPTLFSTPAGMQGVGEAGAEAVLPLDTLWTKMKEILNEAIAASSGASLIDALIERLKGIGSGAGGGQPELAGAGGFMVQYSPVYNLYGSAGKEEIAGAAKMSQEEFNKLMKQYEKDQRRRKL